MLAEVPAILAIATWPFGLPAVEQSYRQILSGASALDAVEAGINITELDTNVTSVGYGGLPNSDGDVELDAAIMDGPGHRAGSVGSIRSIRTPISVARSIMDHCPHVMLVGEGALQFALAHGFQREETLTDRAREEYRSWVERGRPRRWLGGAGAADTTARDSAGPRSDARHGERASGDDAGLGGDAGQGSAPRGPEIDSHDTIGLAALDAQGRLAVGCSTSGLAFKSPGRVGDSPIIGAGLYVEQGVGAASATGVGELILRFSLSHLVVEEMRRGLSPQDACNAAIQRLVQADSRYTSMQVGVIALGQDGRTGAASTRPPQHALSYAVASESGARLLQAEIPV